MKIIINHYGFKNDENIKLEETTYTQRKYKLTFVKNFINPNVLKVSSVTIANGADNIGIYIPLFTRMNLMGIVVTVMIFGILIALWYFIGEKLAEHPFIQKNTSVFLFQ